MKKITKFIISAKVALIAAMSVVMSVTTPAVAWPNPGTNGCLGGTIKVSKEVYRYGEHLGTFRIYKNCNGYYAFFRTNGVPRSLGIQIWNNCGHSAWRS